MYFRPLPRKVPGTGFHRSGWPYAMQSMNFLFDSSAPILLDDYIERTFTVKNDSLPIIHETPWVAICHHPPIAPEWCQTNDLKKIFSTSAFKESLPNLKLAIALAPHSSEWIFNTLRVPTAVVKHPSGSPTTKWSEKKYRLKNPKILIQIGSYLRNLMGIYQLPAPHQYIKIELSQSLPWVERARKICSQKYGYRKNHGTVYLKSRVNFREYDLLLSESVVFLELIDAVATNTVVECIARNTPIVINRLPGIEYYLGRGYPLFYDRFEEAPNLLTDSKIIEAHKYLKHLPKQWLQGKEFAKCVLNESIMHIPEIRHLKI